MKATTNNSITISFRNAIEYHDFVLVLEASLAYLLLNGEDGSGSSFGGRDATRLAAVAKDILSELKA